MNWTNLEGTIEEIYDNIDKYKNGLSSKAKEKGFALLLNGKNGKTIVIADKDLLMLELVKIGNYVKLLGWFNDQNIFLATATMGNVNEEKFKEILTKKK